MTRVTAEADVDLVHEATDLVQLIGEHLALKPKGREHIGVCPFHDDHTPSLTVVTHKGNGFYKCHACGAAGDAFSFVMNY
ncbi:MAG: CHC2 zinc finger domain-containing protein, partial [Acidobacteria bacterium]|nr:CHC2 zinc finger domain-containing protein [Acidobacteriota bacterium]